MKIGKIFHNLLILLSIAAVSSTSLWAAQFDPLIGRWERTDGAYVLEVHSIEEDGNATVRYLDPAPVTVARAEASRHGNNIKLFVKLRDIGHPGSTYILVHDPKKDILLGIYYHSSNEKYFEVIFVPVK